jgi:AraC-like DNA-binding protein
VPGDSFVDLAALELSRRRPAWDDATRQIFPGLSVRITEHSPQRGTITRTSLGAAELYTIESAPAEVRHRPASPQDSVWPHVSLMIQSRGSTRVTQRGMQAQLGEGDMCLIDERDRFSLSSTDYGTILFLRLPRAPAMSRYPHLDQLFGAVLPAQECGTRLLSDTLLRLSEVAPRLTQLQRTARGGSVIQMLGVARSFAELPQSAGWRVRRAVDFIELNFPVAGLTAEDVARDQHISRRRLDQLMREACGQSIASHLWRRRMEQAAADLRDPAKASLSIAQIAFASGFEDAAHFSRAFRRQHAMPPGQWRLDRSAA